MAADDADRGGQGGTVTSGGADRDGRPDAGRRSCHRRFGDSGRPTIDHAVVRSPRSRLDQITAAAIGLADAEGLAAVSMARVAETSGYSTMALYRYVSGKDELLMLMSDATAPDPPDLSGAGSWRDALELWAMSQIGMVVGRPVVPRSAAGRRAARTATHALDRRGVRRMAGRRRAVRDEAAGDRPDRPARPRRGTGHRREPAYGVSVGGGPRRRPAARHTGVRDPAGAAGRRRSVRRFRDRARQLCRSRAVPRPLRGSPGGRAGTSHNRRRGAGAKRRPSESACCWTASSCCWSERLVADAPGGPWSGRVARAERPCCQRFRLPFPRPQFRTRQRNVAARGVGMLRVLRPPKDAE